MEINLYSETYKRKIQIISIITITLILIFSAIEIYNLRHPNPEYTVFMIIGGLVINIISIFLCVLIIIFPARFDFFSLITAIYGLWLLFLNPENILPFFLFYISLVAITVRGFFRKYKKLKIVMILLFFATELLYPLKLGLWKFVRIFFQDFTCLFCLIAGNVFLLMTQNSRTSKKILKLSEYNGLNERDCDWLKRIQSEEKYQKIAIEYRLTEGTVKNRLKKIYDILEVGDKTGFLARYYDFEIVF